MDKILRRVRMAERQVARRAKKTQKLRHAVDERQRGREVTNHSREAGLQIGAAVRARHEDLEMGPLAPRRDVSKIHPTGNYWGSISTSRAMLSTKITPLQKVARTSWAGGPRTLCLAVGDSVVVTEGPYKGKIAAVLRINKQSMSVELDGNVGVVNATVPNFLIQDGQEPVQQVKSLIPISAVRLVHPLADPATGLTRDVIIRELRPVERSYDRPTRKLTFARLVPGLNVKIPWPKEAEVQHEDHPSDTVRLDVEERTFVPTLLRPPLPETVLDELRNRYSKFRTRHTPEYVAEVEAREAEKAARKKGARAGEMMMPLQEYNRKMRELRRARGKPELSDEMLEKIGEVVARNQLVRGQGTGSAAEEVDKVQRAVEQLSLGGDAPGTPGGEQPSV